MDDRAAVLVAACARAHALAAGDVGRLGALLHPDFRWTSHRGQDLDRAAHLARNTDGTTVWGRQDLGDPEVVLVGDAAVLRTTVTDTIERDGADLAFRMPMTQVWTRASRRWQCLAGHAGPLLEP